MAAVASLNPVTSGFFSLAQVLMLWKDIGDAEKPHRLLQNFIAALVNGLVGWAVGDYFAYAGGVVVGAVIFAKALDML